MIGLKLLTITIILTALTASVAGGALVSYTTRNTIDQILNSQTNNPTVAPQANTNITSYSNATYQIPPNATKPTTTSSHESHHASSSSGSMGESMTEEDMLQMMADNGMYDSMQNGSMDAMMAEMMPMMLALMSDNMKAMMVEMMMGNMTVNTNQTMIQEMDKMLQTMDNTLSVLNSIVNASLATGNMSNETTSMLTSSISQVLTMMNQLMQMMQATNTANNTMAPMSVSTSNAAPTSLPYGLTLESPNTANGLTNNLSAETFFGKT